MQLLPTPTHPLGTQPSQRLRAPRPQRGRRPTTPIDRRTPSGRLLAY
jgi:hypothetical protein